MTKYDNLYWLDNLPTGWAQLYRDLLEDLAADGISVRVAEAKEKFGSLRIYLQPGTPEAKAYIAAAELRSKATCQHCGDAGELLVRDHLYATLCPVHGQGFSKPSGEPVVSLNIRFLDLSGEGEV
ncbi:hypothetical protein EDF58_102498 [Novosphingobium sp. PhB57]|uniref:hypothetical protein n=1 Tax=Novosphingobium sp. PhB57 TaxID=2485107 RepID=UPI0010509E93|nr:hypothetical protein [Novosphingobium sp. PhB57]TCU59810.1 hypothetical protein EDF58_102498 [Novosphingobium sp. PhB57]